LRAGPQTRGDGPVITVVDVIDVIVDAWPLAWAVIQCDVGRALA
jgi:hypothetical protein